MAARALPDIAHIITMPHVTEELVDALVDDIANGYRREG